MRRPTEHEIEQWYPRLFRTALRLTGSPEDASDLTQQAFCRALGRWEAFDGRALPTTWLHQILVNCVRDWWRRRVFRSTEPLDEWATVRAVRDQAQPADRVVRREQARHLRRAIQELPRGIRAAFVTMVLDGYTYQEAAELLSVPIGTIASRVHQARSLLQEVMRGKFPEV